MYSIIVWQHPQDKHVKVHCVMNAAGRALHYAVTWCGTNVHIESCESKAICYAKGFKQGLGAWSRSLASLAPYKKRRK